MKAKSIPSSWLERDGRRLDCNPYMSGALEAKVLLEGLKAKKERLADLTAGFKGGIYNGPQFKRNYVDSADHGVQFLTGGDVLSADTSRLPYLSRRDAHSSKLSYLRLEPGMTIISCSGAIGRMAFVRDDMAGVWSSQDVMKVVPDAEKIPPGYLYAYLSSKFGVPLVVGGTYGAIIQHIEPEHIADLAVPRLGRKLEQKAHELVQRAASLRVDANRLLRGVAERFDSLVDGIELKGRRETPRISVVRSSSIQRRFDAQFHDPLVWAVRERLASKQHTTIGEWCTRIFLPGIFKRIHVEDVAYGAPYYTGATLFWMEPQPKGVLSRKTTLFEQVQMDEGTVLVQAFGQEGGLTGRAVWVGRHLAGSTTTHMLVRLRTEVKEDTAYLFGFLQSDAAYRQIASLTYGGSIPHFDEAGIASVVLPLFPPSERRVIAQQVLTAVASRDDALDAERDARALIEDAIEKGATN
jgi:type I restriction enzyme S subunit